MSNSDTERFMIEIWKELFGLEDIDKNTNYFLIGGTSLIALQLSARIHQETGKELPVIAVFENPILGQLVQVVEELEVQEVPEGEKIQMICDHEHDFEPFELTDIQYAYWFGGNGSAVLGKVKTHAYMELMCKGYSLKDLEKAVNKVIIKQPMLRVIVTEDGYQRVLPEVPYYRIDEIKYDSIQDFLTAIEKLRNQIENESLESTNCQLFTIRAVSYDTEVSLHIQFNSILFDGKSIFLFLDEINYYLKNPQEDVEGYSITYRDYTRAIKNIKKTKKYECDKQYVLEQLDKMKEIPPLPLSQSPEKILTQTISHHEIYIESKKWNAFKSQCRKNNLTPNAVLLTIYSEVLALWSNTFEFTLNFTCFDRLLEEEEINRLIGDFTLLLLVNIELKKKENFKERAIKVQENLAKAMDHKYFGTIDTEREIAKRYGTKSSAFPIVFTGMLGMDSDCENFGEISYLSTKTSQTWLDLQAIELGERLMIRMEAVEELLPFEMVEEMLTVYLDVMDKLLEDEAWEVKKPLLAQVKNFGMRDKYNSVTMPVNKDTLDHLFVQQVCKNPDSYAVLSEEKCLTYRELFNLSYELAQKLKDCKGTYVLVMLPKGPKQVVAVMAVLMAGKAYVPLDIENPISRKTRIFSNLHSDAMITLQELENEAKEIGAYKIFYPVLDTKENYNPIDYVSTSKFDDIAYVIFTSGSTGMPKGVVIPHKGVINTILDINRRFSVGETDRTLGLSNLNFDLSVYDIFGMLVCGGAVVTLQEEDRRNPEKWMVLMEKFHVTVWNSVPAFMQMMMEYLKGDTDGSLLELKLVLLSGDRIPCELPNEIQNYAAQIQVVGLGGATEASIWSNYFIADKVSLDWGIVPYGYPLTNQKYYVLNEVLQDCPDYVKGRLYIGGEGLAYGYLNDEEQTNEKFFIHSDKKERIYDTGDNGRYWSDGTIEFLGREDFQVKIRGHRIELGEIEAAFSECENVDSAVAAVIKGEGRESQIAVMIKIAFPNDDRTEEYVKQASDILPDYMMPVWCEVVDKIPLTANGKIDRKEIAKILSEHMEIQLQNLVKEKKKIEEPLTEIQKKVIHVWKEVLEYDGISLDDEFYDYGGNSMLMIRFINRLKELYGIHMTPDVFFMGSTVRELAQSCE